MRGVVFFGLGLATGAAALAAGLAAGPVRAPARGEDAAAAPASDASGAPAPGARPALEVPGTAEEAAAIVRRELARASRGGSYAGRFAYLQPLGTWGIEALAEIASDLDSSDDEQTAVALSAIQALGDLPSPRSIAALETLVVRTDWRRANEYLRDEITHSLFRLGKPAMLEDIIAELERRVRVPAAVAQSNGGPTPWPTPVRLDDARRLGHRLLHAGQYEAAARRFTSIAETMPSEAGTSHYNAACAWARGGKPTAALASLRAAMLGAPGARQWAYADVEWMREDGDLASIHGLPEFEYLAACGFAGRVRSAERDPADIRAALDALARAGAGGYRIAHPTDRDLLFSGLAGDSEFERLWAAMGGTAR
jgi:hypothetical protein